MAFKPKITEKGTELQIMDLRGKAYMPVNQRLVWFREVHPNGSITTEMVQCQADYAVFRAQVHLLVGSGYIVIATGYKKETLEGFPDFIEKAETGAVGRALAMAGFGTQFETGFDEGDRLADSPVESKGETSGIQNSKNAQGKSSVRSKTIEAKQSKTGAANSNGVKTQGPISVPAATVDPVTTPLIGGTIESGLLSQAKNRLDVNNLLSSVSRSLAAKKIKTVQEIKKHMQTSYGTDDKDKLEDDQAAELLIYLDSLNNGYSNGVTANL